MRQRRGAGCGEATGTSAHPELSQGADRRARRRLRRRRRRPDRRRGRRAGRPGCAPTGRPAGRSRRGSPGSGPTRSSGSTSTSARTASELTGRGRTSVPAADQVQRARVDTEVRAVADEVSAPLARPWAESVRRASVSRLPDLNDRLDCAAGRDRPRRRPDPASGPGSCGCCSGCCCSPRSPGRSGSALLARRPLPRRPEPPTPDVGGFPVPTLLLLGGVVLGVLLALLCRLLVSRDRSLAGAVGRPSAARGDLRGRRRAGRRAGARPSSRRTTTVREGLAPPR